MNNDRFKFRMWEYEEGNPMIKGSMLYSDQCSKLSIFWKNAENHALQAKIMQCTGLKDKNGTLIYEGDVVYFKVENQISGGWMGPNEGIIKFKDDNLFFGIHLPKGFLGIGTYLGAHSGSLKTLGNIYENPELTQKPEGM